MKKNGSFPSCSQRKRTGAQAASAASFFWTSGSPTKRTKGWRPVAVWRIGTRGFFLFASRVDGSDAAEAKSPRVSKITRSTPRRPRISSRRCSVSPSAMLDGRVVGRLDEARIDALVAEAQR